MPSVSKSQQRLMGMAYAVKSGDMEISDIDPAYRDKVKSLSDGMTKKDLKKYASTKHDKLPETVDEDFAQAAQHITPSANIGGMGPVVFPSDGVVGSGDVPAVADIDDDEEESKKDKTKKKLEMENFNLYTQFNLFVNESLNEAFKFGKKNQYSIDDVNEAYGFWGTLELAGFKRREIEDNWHSAMAWLTESYKFSDAGALYYLNAKAGRWIADQVIEQKGNRDVVDVLEDYATPAEWKKWSKEYNKFAQEEMMSESMDDALLENAVRDLHFETDPKKAEDMKIAIGKSQGEVTRAKQIEGGEYSLRRFRKEIKYGDGKDLGVFLPGSYGAATSKLGDGPHKKAVKKIKWNRKKYDQWLEDVASNDGWKNAFDMAQNAKNEPGLLQWAKKEFRGEDVMQRIQWDIEAFAESVVTEAKGGQIFPGDYVKTQYGDIYLRVDGKVGGSDAYVRVTKGKAGKRKTGLHDSMKLTLVNKDGLEESVNEAKSINRELMKIDSYLNTKDEDVLVTFLDDYFYNSADKKARKEWDAARDGLGYSDLVDYAVKHADNHGMDLQDMEDAIEVYETKKVKDHFSEWVTLNEKKEEDRDSMMKFIKKHMSFVGTSEDFNDSEGGIHVSGENWEDEFKGQTIYDYYSEDYKNREFGVLNSWEKELNKRGWYSEWYDAGTVMIWPL